MKYGFKLLHPEVKFILIEKRPNTINQETDITILSSLDQKPQHGGILLASDELFLAVGSKHPFSSRESIALAEASHEEFISHHKLNDLHALLLAFCQQAGFTPNVAYESENTSTIDGLIAINAGVTLQPKKKIDNRNLIHYIHVTDVDCTRYIHLVPNANRQSYYVDEFMKFAESHRFFV